MSVELCDEGATPLSLVDEAEHVSGVTTEPVQSDDNKLVEMPEEVLASKRSSARRACP